MFRCVAAIPNTGGNCVEHFYSDTPEGYTSAEAFAQQYNRDGWGVYDCVSPLREERRAKETVAKIVGLHWDLDARQLKESKQEIIEKTHAKARTVRHSVARNGQRPWRSHLFHLQRADRGGDARGRVGISAAAPDGDAPGR
jgi:hypothetical protein